MSAIAVVANDAGAANVLFSLLKEQGDEIFGNSSMFPVVEGPAQWLWCQYFPDIKTYPSLTSIDVTLAGVVTGTGWSSDLEHNARAWSKSAGVKSYALLDHWVNYKPRFQRNGIAVLPDELWVTDDWARSIAEESFPQVPVRQFENAYLLHQLSRIAAPPASGTILYILEPVRDTWGKSEQGEFQALKYFWERMSELPMMTIKKIFLRPHPSESRDKYNQYLEMDPRIEIDQSKDVCEAISKADVVIGVESFALTLALAAGRPVFSSLPPWAPPLRLPQCGILQIRNIASR